MHSYKPVKEVTSVSLVVTLALPRGVSESFVDGQAHPLHCSLEVCVSGDQQAIELASKQ